jgi:tRNA pseudouridine38-40 synthase
MARSPEKSKVQLNRFAVILEYVGSGFAGWQFQENAGTVQAALEAAITKRFGEKRRVGGASRTDSGVHAHGQVAVFDLAYPIIPLRLVAALNSALPPSVRVIRAKRVPQGWDPRQKALEKSYVYLVHNRPVASPHWAGRAWQIYQKLDMAAMRQAARLLTGRRDFSSFRASGCESRSPVRHLKEITITRRGSIITFRFRADAFLYHMVRNLVGTLVEVGKARMPAQRMNAILEACNRKQAGPTAPAEGLYLEKIMF